MRPKPKIDRKLSEKIRKDSDFSRLFKCIAPISLHSIRAKLVMPAHSRSKNGVASLAYVAGIHVFTASVKPKTWMAGTSPAMTAHNTRSPDGAEIHVSEKGDNTN
jgi:hypothetical protein